MRLLPISRVSVVLVCGLMAQAGPACADQPGEGGAGAGELAAGLPEAILAAPALQAARARVEAARARTGAAGRLADPELEFMGSRADMIESGSTMWELNLRQPLPKAGERGADRSRAEAAVRMAEADLAMVAGDMAMEVSMAAAEAEAAERRIDLLEAQVVRMESVLASVDARIAAGGGRLADRLTVQTSVASMRLMIEDERRMADDARAEIVGRLGASGVAGAIAYAAPRESDVAVAETAAVRLAAARESEATAMKSMARAGARPMTGLGLRLEREQTDMGNEDTIGLAFMTEIPWRSRRYARAEERAANADVAAARSDGASARLRVEAALVRAARAARLAATARQLGAETHARLDAELESLIQAASAGSAMTGESTVMMTVDILDKVTQTELQVINAELQEHVARAALWPHVAVTFWSSAPPPTSATHSTTSE